MATLNKDFKIKSGLVVEGLQGTINGEVILTENAGDQYILDLIGGETLVKSVSNEFDVSAGGELSLDRAVVDAYYDAAGSAATAQENAEDYADGLAGNYDAAGSAAAVAADLTTHENDTTAHGATGAVVGTTNTQTLTNKTIGDTLNFTGAGAMTINSDSHIVLTPAAGSSVKWGADVLATQAYADQAEADAKSYADSLASNYDAAGAAAAAQTAAEGFATQAIADLVDSAPATLDTLNELAQALQDNPDIISDLQDIAAGKQDTLTAGANIDITGATISVTGLDSTDISDFNTAALSATASAYDAAGSAAAAQQNAEEYADDLINDASNLSTQVWSAYKTSTEIGLAQQAAIDHADGLDTDDIEEGTSNLYYTKSRAEADAGALIANAQKTNVEITYTGGVLSITAENGVDDSTTDDLTEGETNLYFTDERAVDAIDGANITPATVTIDSYRKEEATHQYVTTASTVNVHSLSGMYESVKYLVRVVGNVTGTKHSQLTEILMTIDGSNNIAITEYGTIYTSETPLATFSAAMVGVGAFAVPTLTATTLVGNTEIIAAATMLSWAD